MDMICTNLALLQCVEAASNSNTLRDIATPSITRGDDYKVVQPA